jgi:hypothetical protein
VQLDLAFGKTDRFDDLIDNGILTETTFLKGHFDLKVDAIGHVDMHNSLPSRYQFKSAS